MVSFAKGEAGEIKLAETYSDSSFVRVFGESGAITGMTFTDDAYGEYSVARCQLMASSFDNATEVNELFDGPSYMEAVKRVDKFNMSSIGLQFFYDDSKFDCFSRRIVVTGFIGRFPSLGI